MCLTTVGIVLHRIDICHGVAKAIVLKQAS